MVLVVTASSMRDAAIASGQGLGEPSVVAGAVAGLSLAVRRRRPLAVTAVTVAAAGLWGLVLPLLVALFHLASRGRAWPAVTGAGVALLTNVLVHPALSLLATRSYGPALLLALAVALGLWAGSRRRLVEALAGQVERLRVERELREQATRAAERSAIAAEMHDVLAHRLSLIALHTGVLATRKDPLPAQVAERLALLRSASTDALTDLRDVLGALRSDPAPDHTPSAGRPAPVLRDVEEVIEQARTAGQLVDTTIEGTPERAPAAHRLAVFRLVQEALTNARKHATGAPVGIRIDYGPPATLIEVINAPGAPGAGGAPVVPSGFGLVGLRERVEALGGHLHAGPGGAGAWRLAARIPHPLTEQNGTRT
ncbi:sensor histidine kinase [Streptomyces sp. NPDC088745]|uniref:sensor histidine kinase n=1 Tax=Streptomyces sp. NPDC088745 TaxID=3365884 RepID=UPI0038078C06